jgi:hypothetical protein
MAAALCKALGADSALYFRQYSPNRDVFETMRSAIHGDSAPAWFERR